MQGLILWIKFAAMPEESGSKQSQRAAIAHIFLKKKRILALFLDNEIANFKNSEEKSSQRIRSCLSHINHSPLDKGQPVNIR